METTVKNSANMDDIVFERRNKLYGAYLLRRLYHKNLTKALLIATAILLAGLAYPIVASYNSGTVIIIPVDTGSTVFEGDVPPEDIPDIPTPPPAAEIEADRIKFVAPQVVDGPVEDGFLPNMDDFNLQPTGDIVQFQPEKVVVKSDPVIIEDPVESKIEIIVEEMPTFPGGEAAMMEYLRSNLVYPRIATETSIQGTVYLQFVVDTKGNITEVKLLRGIGGGCDEEAIRVVKNMPKWNPGKQNGRNVRVLFNMPVGFKIQM